MSDEIIEQIKQNTEELKALDLPLADPPEVTSDESSLNVGNKVVAKLKKVDEKISDTLSVCQDASTQKHVVWTNFLKYVFSYVKYTLVVQSITTLLQYVIGANGLAEVLKLLQNMI